MNAEEALVRFCKKGTIRDMICLGCHHYQNLYGSKPEFIAIRPDVKLSKEDVESICAPLLGVIVRGEHQVIYMDEAMIVRYAI